MALEKVTGAEGPSPVLPELLSWTLNSARTLGKVIVSEVQ